MREREREKERKKNRKLIQCRYSLFIIYKDSNAGYNKMYST